MQLTKTREEVRYGRRFEFKSAGTYTASGCNAVDPEGTFSQELPGCSIELTLNEDGSYTIVEIIRLLGDIRKESDTLQVGINSRTNEQEGTYSFGSRSDDNPNEVQLLFEEGGYLGFLDESTLTLKLWGLHADAYCLYECEWKSE